MSIVEIEKKQVIGTKGTDKKINAGAMGMVMDVLQETQYMKPIPSAVREVSANGIDSQKEKERAISILNGESKLEDHFIERKGEAYEDSNWDESYYNLEYLDKDNNDVILTYKDGEGLGRCDSFIIKDYGVGLSPNRLHKCTVELGYSTKRNSKGALGAFGIGGKSGLATGAEWYKITSVYNGVKTILQIFRKKVNSLIPAFDFDNEVDNVEIQFGESTIYGEKTNEKNGVTVEIPCLKHHKQDYINAVKTQLLYVPCVRFFNENLSGAKTEIDFKAKILHESENLVISSNSPYHKPHVLITNGTTSICYGLIEFEELEMQSLNGAVGVKCNIRQSYIDDETDLEVEVNSGVDVVQSREFVRWTPKTKEYISGRFEIAQEEATKIIQDRLTETDFLKWIKTCKSLLGSGYYNYDDPLSQLSKIVDVRSLKPEFNNTGIKYSIKSFDTIKFRRHVKSYDKSGNQFVVKRDEQQTFQSIELDKLYFQEENSSRLKDCYIADKNDSVFYTCKPISDIALANVTVANGNGTLTIEKVKKLKDREVTRSIKEKDTLVKLIQDSELYQNYEEVEVPEDYTNKLEKVEEAKKDEDYVMSAKERRKLEERIVVTRFLDNHIVYGGPNEKTYRGTSVEPTLKEVMDFKGEWIYGNKKDLGKLQFAMHILDRQKSYYRDLDGKLQDEYKPFYNKDFRITQIAQNLNTKFRKANHKHINDFFGDYKTENGNTTITMEGSIISWYTAKKIKESLEDLRFLANYQNFNQEKADKYKELCDYVQDNYTDIASYRNRYGMSDHYDDFMKFADGLFKIQSAINENAEDSTIVDIVKELNIESIPEGTNSCIVADQTKLELLNELLEYASPVKALFNYIPLLTLEGHREAPSIPMDTELMIRDVIESKGI